MMDLDLIKKATKGNVAKAEKFLSGFSKDSIKKVSFNVDYLDDESREGNKNAYLTINVWTNSNHREELKTGNYIRLEKQCEALNLLFGVDFEGKEVENNLMENLEVLERISEKLNGKLNECEADNVLKELEIINNKIPTKKINLEEKFFNEILRKIINIATENTDNKLHSIQVRSVGEQSVFLVIDEGSVIYNFSYAERSLNKVFVFNNSKDGIENEKFKEIHKTFNGLKQVYDFVKNLFLNNSDKKDEELEVTLADGTIVKEGDYIQELNYQKPLRVYKDKTNGLLGVSLEEAWGVISGQKYIYLKDMKLDNFEKIEQKVEKEVDIELKLLEESKGFKFLRAEQGDNYIDFIVDEFNDIKLMGGIVNNVRIRHPYGHGKPLDYEKDGKKGRINWCFEDANKIVDYTDLNYLKFLKNLK